MKDVIIVYDELRLSVNSVFADKLIAACRKRGLSAEIVLVREALSLPYLPRVAVMRAVDFELSNKLSEKGIKVVNGPSTAQIANDKWLTYELMRNNGIKTMKYSLINDSNIAEFNDFPYVLKSRGGHGGKEVFFIKNKLSLIENFSKLKSTDAVLQQVASVLGTDVRAYVLGGKIFKAVKRISLNDFRSNFCLGGKAEPYELNCYEINLIQKIYSLVGGDFIGIDFVFDDGRAVFNEVEDVVGSRMLYSLFDIDVADKLIEYISNNYLH